MGKIDKEKMFMYVYTQLKKGNFKHWYNDVLELDSFTLQKFIDKNEVYFKDMILNPIVEILYIGIQTSKILNKDLKIDEFIKLCDNTNKLELFQINLFIDEACCDESYDFKTDVLYNIKEIILYSTFEYVNEFYKLSELEIDSFLLFGKNLFYEIQTQT